MRLRVHVLMYEPKLLVAWVFFVGGRGRMEAMHPHRSEGKV
jgi:hypothetical protein